MNSMEEKLNERIAAKAQANWRLDRQRWNNGINRAG